MEHVGPTQKKILLLLLGGLTLALNRSPHRYWKIVKEIRREWIDINRQALERAINSLYKSKLIEEKDNRDGTTTFILSEKGKKRALTYNIEKMKIKHPIKWDGNWRIIISDIPERLKKMRDSLRYHTRVLGFYPLQKSVFVHPFDCHDEIEFITEWYNAKKYIRFIIAHHIDNEIELKKHFKLI